MTTPHMRIRSAANKADPLAGLQTVVETADLLAFIADYERKLDTLIYLAAGASIPKSDSGSPSLRSYYQNVCRGALKEEERIDAGLQVAALGGAE